MESYRIRDLHSPFFVEMRLWWTFYVCFYYSVILLQHARVVFLLVDLNTLLCVVVTHFSMKFILYMEVVL